TDGPSSQTWLYRHTAATRLSHWITVLCLLVLVPSGLQIFNAHPTLYWGERSDPAHALFALRALETDNEEMRGVTEIWGHRLDTTGLLGVSTEDGERVARGFPAWATLPGSQWLAMGRRWHFFFAWIFVLNALTFGLYALLSRHLTRDLVPGGRDLAGLGASLRDHLRFRFPAGEPRYNVLQKLAYLSVIVGLGPLVVLTGLAMSPWVDATLPLLPALFGGRQSARTVHFALTWALVGFTVMHVFMVAVTGVLNNLRGIVTGWARVRHHDGGVDG
ncbi:MAG TPA: cytochrome b/b6 domain-containing protein, partial [Methylomirabilota bacterium]|nr:cytochrome b/b6 domain-containing protein [Methylomirabilota bacterium]